MSHVKNQPSQSAKREELDKFVVRLPDGMRELIADKAKEQRRSMNMEIIQRLVDSFEADLELQRLQAALDDAHFRIRSLQELVQGATA
ncbi:Arc family DNA-binding protein [Ectopseudomonas toyotomiensis]|uniref:Arc family DNA-binding protein n=1 Tax=Ectopseudomonas toyotomiensis TaxID=554344 RepID=UPI003D1535E4